MTTIEHNSQTLYRNKREMPNQNTKNIPIMNGIPDFNFNPNFPLDVQMGDQMTPIPLSSQFSGFLPMGFDHQFPPYMINPNIYSEMFAAHQSYIRNFNLLNNFNHDVNNIKSKLIDEILQFFEKIESLRVEHENVCAKVIKRLEECTIKINPNCRLKAFGSYKTKLMVPGSDIDVHVSLSYDKNEKSKKKTENYENILTFLRSLQKEVKEKISTETQLIEKTNVPVLKYEDNKYKQKVDVSVNSENALKAVEVIQTFNKQYSQFKYLTIIIKSFLKKKNLNDVYSGGLSSYAICLLVISFLQMTEKDLKEKNPNFSLDKLSLGNLLVDFFSFYGNRFNYERIGIDVTNGGSYIELKKQQHIENLSPFPYPFKQDPILSIMSTQPFNPTGIKLHLVDPNDSNNIVTKSTYRMYEIVASFSEAFFLLISTPVGSSPLQRILQDNFKSNTLNGNLNKVNESIENINSIKLELEKYKKENNKLLNEIKKLKEVNLESKNIDENNVNKTNQANEKSNNDLVNSLIFQIEKLKKENETLNEKSKNDSLKIKEYINTLNESRVNFVKLNNKIKRLEEDNRIIRLKNTELKDKYENKIKEFNSNPQEIKNSKQIKINTQVYNENIEELFKAIKYDEIDKAKAIILKGNFDINYINLNFETLLHSSLKKIEHNLNNNLNNRFIPNLTIPLLLLKYKAIPDFNLKKLNVSDLSIACNIGNIELVEKLIESGAELNFSSNKSPSPLHIAIKNNFNNANNLQLISILSNKSSLDLNVEFEGYSILPYCIKYKRLDALKIILENQKPEIKIKLLQNKYILKKYNLLMLACKENNYEISEYLLNSGIDPNELSGEDSLSAFSILWEYNNDPYILSELIINDKYNYKINITDIEKVVKKGSINFANILKQQFINRNGSKDDLNIIGSIKPSDINIDYFSLGSSNPTPKDSDSDISDDFNQEILDIDSIRKSIKEKKPIFNNYISQPKSNDQNSIKKNNYITNSIKLDIPIISSNTNNLDIQQSSTNQKKKSKKEKKKKKLKMSHQESKEELFIKNLSEMGSTLKQQSIKETIEAGSIDVNYRNQNDNNKTILHYLIDYGYFIIIDAILKKDIDINVMTLDKETPLILAANKLYKSVKENNTNGIASYNTIIKMLLEKGKADPNQFDNNKDTALHIVCKAGRIDSARYLLKARAPINAQNKDLQTPLHIILQNQSEVKLKDNEIYDFVVEFFNQADLDTTIRDMNFRNYLTLGIDLQIIPVIKILLDRCNIESKIPIPKDDLSLKKDDIGKKGKIPLLLYAIKNQTTKFEVKTKIIKLLLKKKEINPNEHYLSQNIFYHTLNSESEDLCLFLLKKCPKIEISKDALSIANQKKYFKLYEKLNNRKKKKKKRIEFDPTELGYQQITSDSDEDTLSIRISNPLGKYK